MANINDLGRLIANAVKAGLQDVGVGGNGAVVNSSNAVMPRPTFTNLTPSGGGPGDGGPPYGAGNVVNPPFANGGSGQGGRPSFSGMAATVLGGTLSLMPGSTQANFVNYANTRLAGMFPSGAQGQRGLLGLPPMPGDDLTGRYNAASQYARQIAQASTITNPMDVYAGLQKLSLQSNFGIMGDVNAGSFLMGAGAMSNLAPGAGYEKTATSLFSSLMRPRGQNVARMMGLSITDPETGRPKDPRAIADQIWNRLNAQKIGGSPITKDDIQRALLPGRSLDSLLNQLVGDDTLSRNLIASVLIAKAMSGGASAYDVTTKEALLKLGFTTEGMTSASGRAAAEMGAVQSVARAETYGLTKANEAATILAETLTRLNNQLGFGNLPGVLTGFVDGISPRAEGGGVGSKNAYLVGEAGPELFIPDSNGYVVSNNDLRLAGARHSGGFVHQHPHPEWSSKDFDDKGRMNSDKVKEILAHVGFKGSQINNAMQIIGKESARRPSALNPDAGTGDLSYGLFQINMIGNLGPDRRKRFGLASNEVLYDPLKNAQVGYAMSNQGTDWDAWTTAKGLGLSNDGPTRSSINTVSSSESGTGFGKFFNSVLSMFPSLTRNMMGSAAGNVINYGGVKVEVVIPKGADVNGKTLVKQIESVLLSNQLLSKARTQ